MDFVRASGSRDTRYPFRPVKSSAVRSLPAQPQAEIRKGGGICSQSKEWNDGNTRGFGSWHLLSKLLSNVVHYPRETTNYHHTHQRSLNSASKLGSNPSTSNSGFDDVRRRDVNRSARPGSPGPTSDGLIENGFKRRHRRENVATRGYRENLPLGVPEDWPIAMVDRRQMTDERPGLEGAGGKCVFDPHPSSKTLILGHLISGTT